MPSENDSSIDCSSGSTMVNTSPDYDRDKNTSSPSFANMLSRTDGEVEKGLLVAGLYSMCINNQDFDHYLPSIKPVVPWPFGKGYLGPLESPWETISRPIQFSQYGNDLLHVDGIDPTIDEGLIRDIFELAGPVITVYVDESRGYALVQYLNAWDLERALWALQGLRVFSCTLKIKYGEDIEKWALSIPGNDDFRRCGLDVDKKERIRTWISSVSSPRPTWSPPPVVLTAEKYKDDDQLSEMSMNEAEEPSFFDTPGVLSFADSLMSSRLSFV
ncbi:uncharacterized protein I303_100153 [Kwoniella dejecticola CBS 10117]|uniref:RRM domain-containing protein n=1 Tax=Kwoniella dejecticola CBS 10117 TaxID=1296121 RepID=A0A1A6AE41_9TREE|nr:uncharacterized protein I303_00153 [Kwoniella dejecticola CBS 10117]OBR88342.1 hypothetical protein I303_00153 [Kwoniella dejecticola CBS 10117]